MKYENKTSQIIIILRWIMFLPISFFASWISWYLVTLINRIGMWGQMIEPDSFLSKLFIFYVSYTTMGFIFVYIGAKIAPSHKNSVVYFLAGFGLFLAGFLFFPAFMTLDYWAIFCGFSLIFGLILSSYSIIIKEIKI